MTGLYKDSSQDIRRQTQDIKKQITNEISATMNCTHSGLCRGISSVMNVYIDPLSKVMTHGSQPPSPYKMHRLGVGEGHDMAHLDLQYHHGLFMHLDKQGTKSWPVTPETELAEKTEH